MLEMYLLAPLPGRDQVAVQSPVNRQSIESTAIDF